MATNAFFFPLFVSTSIIANATSHNADFICGCSSALSYPSTFLISRRQTLPKVQMQDVGDWYISMLSSVVIKAVVPLFQPSIS